MIKVNNKKMIGNIATAKNLLPYALYQGQRLDMELERLGKDVGYRNIILDDDSRVYLFFQNGTMNTVIEGAPSNTYQPLKKQGDWASWEKVRRRHGVKSRHTTFRNILSGYGLCDTV